MLGGRGCPFRSYLARLKRSGHTEILSGKGAKLALANQSLTIRNLFPGETLKFPSDLSHAGWYLGEFDFALDRPIRRFMRRSGRSLTCGKPAKSYWCSRSIEELADGCHFERPRVGRLVEQERTTVCTGSIAGLSTAVKTAHPVHGGLSYLRMEALKILISFRP
jgi:hypothetical protein